MKWFNNLSITQKMIALVGCLLALTLMVSTYSITKMKRVAVEIEAIAHDNTFSQIDDRHDRSSTRRGDYS